MFKKYEIEQVVTCTINLETSNQVIESIEKQQGRLKTILENHWQEFWPNNKHLFPDDLQENIEESVEKALGCGDPANGFAAYRCTSCGKGHAKVGFSCKSRFCPSCGKVYVDKWVEKTSKTILDMRHRHLIFTIPYEFRYLFYWNRDLLKDLANLAAETVIAVLSYQHKKRGGKRKLMPGIIAVIHTFSRDMGFNPHIHILLAEKAIDKKGKKFFSFAFILYKSFHKVWQRKLLDFLRKRFKGDFRVSRLIAQCWKKNRKGLVVHLGKPMNNSRRVARYIGRYLGRPVIAQYRIIKYDGRYVTFWYDDHKSGKREILTLSVNRFIVRLVMHIAKKNFQMVRRYGFYARNVSQTVKTMIAGARAMVQQVFRFIKGEKRSWRIRLIESFGRDPLRCPYCGDEMELWVIWHPRFGVIYDIFEDSVYVAQEKEEEKTNKTAQTEKEEKGTQLLFPFMGQVRATG